MPILTTNLGTQNTAGSAGVSGLPQVGSIKQYTKISDEFNRETLNPTGSYNSYTSVSLSSGTSAVSNGNTLVLTTAATLNDYVTVRTSGITILRTCDYIDNRNAINMDILFGPNGTVTNYQMFVGIVATFTNLSALPTTTRHMGIYVDTSVSNNYKLSSADGTNQTTTDTGVAVDNNEYRLNISWTGNDAAVISLYSSANNYSTLVKSQTVTSIDAGVHFPFEIHLYTQALTAGAKILRCMEWQVSAL